MIKLTNFGGFLILIYMFFNIKFWNITANENFLFSRKLFNILGYLPSNTIYVICILIMILYLISFTRNKFGIILYFLSVTLFSVALKISINTLMLEQTNSFIFFNINVGGDYIIHLKTYYFNECLFQIIQTQYPELLTNKDLLHEFISQIQNKLDLNVLQSLNAEGINDCLNEILKDIDPNCERAENFRNICNIFAILYFVFITLHTLSAIHAFIGY